VNDGISCAKFPIRKSPVEGSVDPLTIGDRGFVLHVNCVRVNRELPRCDIPISEGEITEGLLWVTRDSQGELEELRLFGLVVGEGPGGSGRSLRGRLRHLAFRCRI
jgi:hypothetical protein